MVWEEAPVGDIRVAVEFANDVVRATVAETREGKQQKGSLPIPEHLTHGDSWLELLDGAGMVNQWDGAGSRLRVRFSDASDVERQSRYRELEIDNPHLYMLGQFERCIVPSVPIYPATRSDATDWSRWLLRHSLREYATLGEYEEKCRKATDAFPEFAPALPTREALLAEYKPEAIGKLSRSAWCLQAALDWKL